MHPFVRSCVPFFLLVSLELYLVLKTFNGVSRKFKGCLKFQGSFKGVYRKFQEFFNEVYRVFQESSGVKPGVYSICLAFLHSSIPLCTLMIRKNFCYTETLRFVHKTHGFKHFGKIM